MPAKPAPAKAGGGNPAEINAQKVGSPSSRGWQNLFQWGPHHALLQRPPTLESRERARAFENATHSDISSYLKPVVRRLVALADSICCGFGSDSFSFHRRSICLTPLPGSSGLP